MKPTSLRVQLLGWIGTLLGVLLVGFGICVFELVRASRLADVDKRLSLHVAAISNSLHQVVPGGFPGHFRGGPPEFGSVGPDREPNGPPEARDDGPMGPPPGKAGPDELSRGMESFDRLRKAAVASEGPNPGADGRYYAVWTPVGKRLVAAPDSIGEVPLPERSSAAGETITFRDREGYREAFVFTGIGDCILVGIPSESFRSGLVTLAVWIVVLGSVVLVLGLGGVVLVLNRSLAPVVQITGTATRVASGALEARIPVGNPDDELGRLAADLNAMFARLEILFNEQKQFTADASHEFRTPLTVIISETQTALSRIRTPEEYQESLEVCLEAAHDLRRIAESLLTIARFDAGQGMGPSSRFDLKEAAQAALDTVAPIAAEKEIAFQARLASSPVEGDPSQMRRVILNLLDNAIYYNVPRGSVTISTRADAGHAYLVVSDTGPGIPAEDLPHIFKRFYRASRVREHTDRRSGLGLAIVQAIVSAHGGSVAVESRFGAGTTFTVKLPLAPGIGRGQQS